MFYSWVLNNVMMYENFVVIECKEGKYGDECIFDCGCCRNKMKCDYVDGICVYGCELGYSLDYC